MEQLRSITKDNLLQIAELVNPSAEWEFYESPNKWDGMDVIAEGFIFQIDFGGNEGSLLNGSSFRYYHSSPTSITQIPISLEKLFEIFRYLVKSDILHI